MEFYECLPIVLIANCGERFNEYLRLGLETTLSIDFRTYVKGQNHLNVVSRLCKCRRITEYQNALKCLDGDMEYFDDAVAVLQYFYEDLSGFLMNYSKDLNFGVSVGEIGIPSEVISFSETKERLLQILRLIIPKDTLAEINPEILENSGLMNVSEAMSLETAYENFPYVEFFDLMCFDSNSVSKALSHLNNYTGAAIFYHYAKKTKRVVMEA